jgi:hypothetical protein
MGASIMHFVSTLKTHRLLDTLQNGSSNLEAIREHTNKIAPPALHTSSRTLGHETILRRTRNLRVKARRDNLGAVKYVPIHSCLRRILRVCEVNAASSTPHCQWKISREQIGHLSIHHPHRRQHTGSISCPRPRHLSPTYPPTPRTIFLVSATPGVRLR